ncbi:hypothetical protein D1000_06220 [Riemerella anatipestifer]|nr:hypothetical protein [Riemerella anatipestifer]MRN16416.1 hypothetical protein [Riemerella anatipestifer]MRQ22298.1 hypothetical protein [Riemerella anatipestifer]UZF07343.1 hypothetical protein D9O39_02010 [Riemerella anatipestifer]
MLLNINNKILVIMKKYSLITILVASTFSFAQIKTNSNVLQNTISAQTPFLDVSSSISWNNTTNIGKGLVFPRTDLTKLSTLVATPNGIGASYPNRLDGMVVYNTATGKSAIGNIDVTSGFYYYENKSNTLSGGTWKPLGGTSPITANIYTADGTLAGNRTVTLGTNNLSFMGDGNVGIGTKSPSQKLEVNGNAKINQMTDATPLENEYTKAVVAKPDGTLGVVSRTNPTIPSGVDVIYGNIAENVDAMEGQTFYDIEKNSASIGAEYTRYTGQSITLPPGKWVVYCAYLLHPTHHLTDNQTVWVRGTISETKENGLFGYISTAVTTGSPLLISANILPYTSFNTASGIWMINNNSTTAKTYYVKISIDITSGTFVNTPTTTLSSISYAGGSVAYAENYLFALKRN